MMSLRSITLLMACLLLAACGFQLRGEARLPPAMDSTWLDAADDSSAFVRQLALQLEANGVSLLDQPDSDAAVLLIHGERMQHQALTISGQARVREFMLIFEVDFELLGPDGEVLVERESLSMTRDYSFDAQEILAAQREREFLEDDLRRAMSVRLLRRLEAVNAP